MLRKNWVALPLAAAFGSTILIAGSLDAAAQQHGRPAMAAPAARPAAPAAMARPAAPAPHFSAPAMARPAAPAFHAAPAMQRPAAVPHAAPHFAAPARQTPQRLAAPRSIQHLQRVPSVASRSAERTTRREAAPSVKAAVSRQERSVQRQEARGRTEQARQQRQATERQATEQRQREALSRQTTDRQGRIDHLQQRVQQLQAQGTRGRKAQRELQSQQQLLSREREAQQRDLAQQQRLGAPAAPRTAAAAQAATQAAARGRFAAGFRNNADPNAQAALAARLNGWAPRNAWRHHVRANFVPWLGPVFWPYAYADIFDYTFWPYAYDDAYWAYAYDDFFDTVFWDVGSPYSAYASIAPDEYIEPGSAMVGSSRLVERSGLSRQALQKLCSNPDQGITAWPFADITRNVQPTAKQRDMLDQLKRAAAQASDVLKNSCSDQYALTPPDRLQAMINRISATLEAVRIVRPPLEAFYNSLSDEQQARFNNLGPQLPSSPQAQAPQEANARSGSCGPPKTSLTQLPIERIKSVVHPTGAQRDALDRLHSATDDAVRILQKACPDEVPVTPVGRLQAMEQRLSAMLQAANQVKPALDEFYASLNSEQKQRFNTLQQVAER